MKKAVINHFAAAAMFCALVGKATNMETVAVKRYFNTLTWGVTHHVLLDETKFQINPRRLRRVQRRYTCGCHFLFWPDCEG